MPATKAQLIAQPDTAGLPTLDSDIVHLEEWTGGSPASAHDELIGTVLNETYRVERVLGEGGMGRVYEARHARIAQKQVAVKVLHRQFARDRDALARFQREAEAAASISHPNVVAVLDVDRAADNMPYMVCEYLQGIDLAEYLKRAGTLDLGMAIYVARHLCLGLEAAHARGVIHRDLKPHNIFLVGDFTNGMPERPLVKIVDFGLSRILHADAELTKAGIIMGTPAFMAPEQALGQKADHRADVYGVGAILYKALTGHAPYERETPQAAVIAVLTGEEPPPLRTLAPSIPVQVELLVERAMARDPAQRYASAGDLARVLEQLELVLVQPTRAATPPRPDEGAQAKQPRTVLPLEASEAEGARSRLVLWLLAAAATLACASPVVVSGLAHMLRLTLSRLELGLTLGLVFVALLVSGAVLVDRIRRNVWTNTARVVIAAGHARASLLAALAVLGFGFLSLHVVDDFLVRFVSDAPLAPLAPLGADWLGWNAVLPLVATLAAATVFTHRRLLLRAPRTWRRVFAAWLVVALGLLSSVAVAYGGLLWRAAMRLHP